MKLEQLSQSAIRKITSDEFFYVEQDNYDAHAELAIPFYREMHDALPACAPRVKGPLRVLDLGSGTGKTSLVFLKNFPGATVCAVDLFETMHAHAKRRLSYFGNRVRFATGDFMEIPLGNNYDVCVSALAIHHQTSEGKKLLFERVFEALASEGRFLMIDWTLFDNPAMQSLALANASSHVQSRNLPAHVQQEWINHWHVKNIPDTVENMCSWLREAGFSHAECVMRYFGMALICADKK